MESKYASEAWAAEAKEAKRGGGGGSGGTLGAKGGAKSTCEREILNDEIDEEAEANAEWEMLKRRKKQGEIRVSSNPAAQRILRGFRINHMRMRDAESGRLMWRSDEWGDEMFEKEMQAHVPASILECRAVAREINFTSDEEMTKFRLEQRVYFQGVCMEEWFFNFGFVIPGSTNNWEQTIYAAEKSSMMPAHLISGQITIETSFFDDNLFVSKSLVRIFYDQEEPDVIR